MKSDLLRERLDDIRLAATGAGAWDVVEKIFALQRELLQEQLSSRRRMPSGQSMQKAYHRRMLRELEKGR